VDDALATVVPSECERYHVALASLHRSGLLRG
jgi:hypothetical protein